MHIQRKYDIIPYIIKYVEVLSLMVLIPGAQESIQVITENNMLDLSNNACELIDSIMINKGVDQLSDEELAACLKGKGLKDYSTSYGYIVDRDGVFHYHQKTEKIGTVVTNEYIGNLLNKLDGSYERSAIFHYTDENGVDKYASYCVSDVNKWIVVMLASEPEVMEQINSVRGKACIAAVVSIFISAFICVVYARTFTRPIQKVTELILNTAELNFSEYPGMDILMKRTDETGAMSRAAEKMQENLRKFANHMDQVSKRLNTNATELTDISSSVSDVNDSNSATAEQLAAYMQETSATTENITHSVDKIKNSTEDIADMSKNGVQVTEQLMDRAQEMQLAI